MKAAVVFQKGELPKYVENYTVPKVQHENEVLVDVKAAAVKNLDKMRASGSHYSLEGKAWEPFVVGGDAVGLLEDGARVYALGWNEMIAEKAIVNRHNTVKLPDNLDNATAAALPNAVMGAAMAMLFQANLQKGETVLINGATGVTGRVATQLAKHYGAQKVIVTGRNKKSLQELVPLGADDIVLIRQDDDDAFVSQINEIHLETPIAVVIDYLWAKSAELILSALKNKGFSSQRIRFVSVGSMLGDTITLPSSILRSTDIHITGSGIGSWKEEELELFISKILPEAFQLAADGLLKIETTEAPLKDIEKVWNKHFDGGKRLVITI